MKTIYALILLCLLQSSVFAQVVMKYASTQNELNAALFSNGQEFSGYESKSGALINIGDTLMIGRPSTSTNTFTYLINNKYSTGNALMGAIYHLNGSYQASKLIVDNVIVYHTKPTKKSPLKIVMYLRDPSAPKFSNYRSVLDYEMAVLLGELINLHEPLTREQAIAKLKEAKDLVDLGMLTQAKFDSMKVVLAPFIK